jgi:hypothetical protein
MPVFHGFDVPAGRQREIALGELSRVLFIGGFDFGYDRHDGLMGGDEE